MSPVGGGINPRLLRTWPGWFRYATPFALDIYRVIRGMPRRWPNPSWGWGSSYARYAAARDAAFSCLQLGPPATRKLAQWLEPRWSRERRRLGRNGQWAAGESL